MSEIQFIEPQNININPEEIQIEEESNWSLSNGKDQSSYQYSECNFRFAWMPIRVFNYNDHEMNEVHFEPSLPYQEEIINIRMGNQGQPRKEVINYNDQIILNDAENNYNLMELEKPSQ